MLLGDLHDNSIHSNLFQPSHGHVPISKYAERRSYAVHYCALKVPSFPEIPPRSKPITNLQKPLISLPGPAPGPLPKIDHRRRGHHEHKRQHPNRNKRVLHPTYPQPLACAKAENHPDGVVDDRHADHALENHVRVRVHQVRHAQIPGAAPPEPDEPQRYIRCGPRPAVLGAVPEHPDPDGEDTGRGEHEPEAELGLHDAAVALRHPDHESVGKPAAVETANHGANQARDVHVAVGGVAVVPGRAVPVVLDDGQVEGEPGVLRAPLQAAVPDGGEGEDAEDVPEALEVLFEARAFEVAGGSDERDALAVGFAFLGGGAAAGVAFEVVGVGGDVGVVWVNEVLFLELLVCLSFVDVVAVAVFGVGSVDSVDEIAFAAFGDVAISFEGGFFESEVEDDN